MNSIYKLSAIIGNKDAEPYFKTKSNVRLTNEEYINALKKYNRRHGLRMVQSLSPDFNLGIYGISQGNVKSLAQLDTELDKAIEHISNPKTKEIARKIKNAYPYGIHAFYMPSMQKDPTIRKVVQTVGKVNALLPHSYQDNTKKIKEVLSENFPTMASKYPTIYAKTKNLGILTHESMHHKTTSQDKPLKSLLFRMLPAGSTIDEANTDVQALKFLNTYGKRLPKKEKIKFVGGLGAALATYVSADKQQVGRRLKQISDLVRKVKGR